MNIREAKEEIKRTAEIYLDKDEQGEYTIPYMKQRPVFMVGAPGIGKTAIMEQIAAEMDIALVSYSMTHHTRQSALGLPYIAKKEYDGRVWQVSEYTMSEIIAAVYEVMKESGKREGILFLDEINCVSETLTPAMLLFLQYKVFGNKRLPEGWVIVTAGNPPEYNKSVKDFDIATLDRLKCFRVEEDFGVWKAYAYELGVHAAVISFLEINKSWFYSIRTTVDGQEYVTARGWEDLSRAIQIYEKKGFQVDRRLIRQYVTDGEIARKFGIYYDLFLKYRAAYRVEDILKGNAPPELMKNGSEAGFDERISLLGLLLENLNLLFLQAMEQETVLQRVVKLLRIAKKQITEENLPLYAVLYTFQEQLRKERKARQAANSLNPSRKEEYRRAEQMLESFMETSRKEAEPKKQFLLVKKEFDILAGKHGRQTAEVKEALEHVFAFIESVWGEGQEMVLFMTELTANTASMSFIQRWGSDSYFRHNQELLVYDREKAIKEEIEALGLTEEE